MNEYIVVLYDGSDFNIEALDFEDCMDGIKDMYITLFEVKSITQKLNK